MRIPRPPFPLSLLLALLLGAACSVLVACGSKDNPHLLSPARADRLNGLLDDTRSAVDGGDCNGAKRAVRDLDQQIAGLPRDTDPLLRRNLQNGARNLAQRVPQDCQQTQTTPTVTETVPTVTETQTTETQTTETQTQTTPTQTETTPTQTETTPTQTSTTPDSGGSTAPAP